MSRKFLAPALCALLLQPADAWAAGKPDARPPAAAGVAVPGAEGKVLVRSVDRGAFARVEFVWPDKTGYTVKTLDPGHYRIGFDKSAVLDTAGLTISANLATVQLTSRPGAKLVLDLTGPPGGHVAASAAGRVVTLDIYGAPAVSAPIKSSPAAPAAIPPVATPAPTAPVPAPQARPPSDAALQPVDAGAVVTISSMKALGLAVFEAGHSLWIVADKPDLPVPPQVAGPQAGAYGHPQKVDAPQASAWRIGIPPDADPKVMVATDGLSWRITLGAKGEAGEVEPVRQDAPRAALIWPLPSASRIVRVTDPDNGNVYDVATVGKPADRAGAPYRGVDFETLPSYAGVAVLPLSDAVTVAKTDKGVEVGKPQGLALSTNADLKQAAMHDAATRPVPVADAVKAADGGIKMPVPGAPVPAAGMQPFFDLAHWTMGGIDALSANRTMLLGGMKGKELPAQAQDLVTLAKMNIANDRGEESLGFLDYADDILPALADNPEFLALRGAGEALAGKYELALDDLTKPSLANYRELDYWRAYTLAWLEDWKQAAKVMPADLSLLLKYPQPLLEKLAPKLAEIALRQGDYIKADRLLAALKADQDTLQPWTKAAVAYLEGQAARLHGDTDRAVRLWKPLVSGNDNFYRVRAGLALTMLETEKGKETPAQATDRLEGLRYAWRGDELEAQINFMLGKLYVQQRQFLKAFTILRDAAQMSGGESDVGGEIGGYMTDTFRKELMTDDTLPPIDAMNIYQQFHELAPPGDAGNKLVQRLADRLATADLLGRAGDLLQTQVDYSLQGQEQADVALRLAAISLLNKDPRRAYAALDKAEAFYAKAPAGDGRGKALRSIQLMRARGTAQDGKAEQALAMLSRMPAAPDVSRLRADIAWAAGLWPDAGDALQELILQANLADPGSPAGQPLTDAQADLILNRAVALNLGGDRVELAKMRELYGARMKPTSRGALFDVVTRPHSINVMSEQPTLQGMVGEVDMFKDFLNGYRNVVDGTKPGTGGAK